MSLDDLALAKSSAKLLDDLKKDLVFTQFCNKDYEGEAKFAGSVKIYQAGFPTISTGYTRDSTSITYERLNPAEQILTITQRDWFALKADDLEQQLAFAGGEMWQRTIRNGAYGLAKTIDSYISTTIMKAAVPSANYLSARTLGLGMGASAYDLMVDLAKALRLADVPMIDCHAAVDPNFMALLKKDDRFSSFNTVDAQKVIRGEVIGVIDQLQIHQSTNIPLSGSTYTIIAGSTEGTTYAEQLSKMENVPRQATDFDDRVRSQIVFDAKVTQPQCLVACDVQYAS